MAHRQLQRHLSAQRPCHNVGRRFDLRGQFIGKCGGIKLRAHIGTMTRQIRNEGGNIGQVVAKIIVHMVIGRPAVYQYDGGGEAHVVFFT